MPKTKRSTPSANRSSTRKRKLTTTVVTKPTKSFFKPLDIKPAPEPVHRNNTHASEPRPPKNSSLESTEPSAVSGAKTNPSLSSSEAKRPQRRTSRRHFLTKPTTNSAKLSTSPEESDEPVVKDETQVKSEEGEQTLTASQDSILPLSKNRAADEPTFKVDCGDPTTPKYRRSSRLNLPMAPSQESNASSAASIQLKLPLRDVSKKRTPKRRVSAKSEVQVIEITDLELDAEAKKADEPASANEDQSSQFNTPPGDPALEHTDDSRYPINELVLPLPIPSSGGLSFTTNVLASAIAPGTTRKPWSTCVPFSGVIVPSKKRAVKGACCTKCGAPADFRVPEHASPVTPVEDMSPLRLRKPKSAKRKTVADLSSSDEKILASKYPPFLRRNLPTKGSTASKMHQGPTIGEKQEKPRRASRLSRSRSLAAKQVEVDKAVPHEPARRFTRGSSRRTRAVKRGVIDLSTTKETKVAVGACVGNDEPVDVDREDEPVEVDVVDLCAESPKRRPFSWTQQGSPKRRRVNWSFGPGKQAKVVTAVEVETAVPTAKPKQLHSFFTNKPKIVSTVRSDMRKQPVAPHPWKSAFATVHVNAPKYDGPYSTAPSLLDLPSSCMSDASLPPELSIPEETDGEDLHANSVVNERKLSDEAVTALWSEVYQHCDALGPINSSSTTSLQDWLRMWYRFKPERSEEMCSEDYSSDDVFIDDLELGLNENTAKIAIVTGPVGCGKSTVVKQVARRLGLSILEINQTMCRSSKKVRELVTNALENHRATKNRQSPADTTGENNGYSARTLILFEEVDELHEDEAGFWRMVREVINDEKCKRPIVCTANRITSSMQAVFGYVTPNDEKDIRELLTEYPPEEQLNTLPFQHFPLEQKSPSEIMKVLKVVNEGEGLSLSNRDMVKFARSIRSEELRTVLNTLQFWSTPSKFGVVSQVSHLAESCSRLLCTEDAIEKAANIAYQERMDEDAAVLEGVLYGVTELSSQGHDGLCEVADLLETFSDADVLCRYQGFEEDHAMADALDLLPAADDQQYWNSSRFIATDMRVNALTSLNTSFRWDEVDPVWLTNQVEEYIGNGRKSEAGVETVKSLLNKRTAVTDILPSLRTMAVASREARERAASGKGAKGKQATGKFSKVPLGTRSRTRGNHMHLLGIGEEASIYLEHNCMLPEHR